MQGDAPLPDIIADEAARWFAARDSGLPVDELAFARWLRSDPRHGQAYREIEALWSDLGRVPASPQVRASLKLRRPVMWRRVSVQTPRRRWLPTAIAASMALLVMGIAQDWPTWLRADAMTATGERRSINLPDGSRVELNTASAIAVDMQGARRVIRLLKGEAAFDVAPDRNRPFMVEAAGGSSTALGTRFIVRNEGSVARVTVTEHRVRVAFAAAGVGQTLNEGQAISYGSGHALGRVEAVNGADAAAWMQGLLVFENRPLGQVVDELARYHPGYIRAIGSAARERRVSGVFRIDDPVGAVDKIAHVLNLRSARMTDRLIVLFD